MSLVSLEKFKVGRDQHAGKTMHVYTDSLRGKTEVVLETQQ